MYHQMSFSLQSIFRRNNILATLPHGVVLEGGGASLSSGSSIAVLDEVVAQHKLLWEGLSDSRKSAREVCFYHKNG